MKKIFYLLAAITMIMFIGCKKENAVSDIPSVGNIAINSTMKVYSHGLQGWIKSDTVGVYVLSDGFPQENVMYVPSQTAKPMDNRGFIMYDKRNPVSKDILLTPVKEGKEICFKAGKHQIFAYTPASKESKDYKNVALPDISVQEPSAKEFTPLRKYGFYYTSATIGKYSSAAVALGDMKPLFSQITLPPVAGPDELFDKQITKLTIKADKPIAYKKGAVIDLSTLKIKGEGINSIEFKMNGKVVKSRRGGSSLGKMPLFIMVAVPYEVAKDMEFEFIFTIDGKDYSTKGKNNSMIPNQGNNLAIISNPIQ